MFRALLLVIAFLGSLPQSNASIFCPPDKNMLCSDDKYNLDKLGRPILLGNSLGRTARYIDDNQLNSCQAGYIYRKWYVDYNNDNQWQQTELFCIQTLYFAYEFYPISIQWPSNKTYSCKEDIVFEKPTWVTGPCNVLGYSYKDDIFEVSDEACYKILRRFKVVDWCDSDGDGIMNVWEHTQVIKVVDEDAPKILSCTPSEFHVGQDCKAEIILVNKASDDQACGNQKLQWTVWVDLWANGDYDLEYSNLKTGEFYLAPVQNGAEVLVKIPERIGVGSHKVHWSVADECGNIRSCISIFTVVDKKPPTPYVHIFLTAAFDATSMPLMVPARIFNVGSFDNCTPKNKLRFSFSEDVNDTIRVVDCTNAGFQFFTLYVTDKAGNQEIIDVFLLAFDNGSCNASSYIAANLTEGNGLPLASGRIWAKRESMTAEATSMGQGLYEFNNLPLYSDFKIEASSGDLIPDRERINIHDLVLLQEHVLGLRTLTHFELVAADVDMDHALRAKDLVALHRKILRNHEPWKHGMNYRVIFEPDSITPANLSTLKNNAEVMAYDGCFDFRAVLIGDISEANKIETENRNTSALNLVETSEGLELFVAENLNLKGLQLEFSIDTKEITLSSSVLDLTPGQLYTNQEGFYRILVADEMVVSPNIPLLTITGAGMGSYVLHEGSGVVIGDGEFQKLRLVNRDTESEAGILYPNPMVGETFFLQANSIVKRINDADGRHISFEQSGNVVHLGERTIAGMLFVQIQDKNGHISVKKLTKLP